MWQGEEGVTIRRREMVRKEEMIRPCGQMCLSSSFRWGEKTQQAPFTARECFVELTLCSLAGAEGHVMFLRTQQWCNASRQRWEDSGGWHRAWLRSFWAESWGFICVRLSFFCASWGKSRFLSESVMTSHKFGRKLTCS